MYVQMKYTINVIILCENPTPLYTVLDHAYYIIIVIMHECHTFRHEKIKIIACKNEVTDNSQWPASCAAGLSGQRKSYHISTLRVIAIRFSAT